ncbi:MAG: recombinase family protein [Phenylobacterium sp.]|nr:MAG: recombinase family protein [Phenylobacterium sp.]
MIVSVVDGDPTVDSVLVRLGEGDELVVERLEDLGGELGEVVRTLEQLQLKRVHLKVLREGLDSASGDMAATLSGLRAAAEFQQRTKHEAWRRGIDAAREAGAFRGGRPRKTLDLDVLAELRTQGVGATEIARRLNVSRWSVYRRLKQLDGAA